MKKNLHSEALRSWKGRWLRDGYENRLGIILRVEEDDEITLITRFQGEAEERRIGIEPRSDGEYVHPDSVRARYRLLSPEEARSMLQ